MTRVTTENYIEQLQAYLYDHLIGRNRKQSFTHGQAFLALPRDVVKSVAQLSKQYPTADKQQIANMIATIEGNIMVAQTMGLLVPEVAANALDILDKITVDKR